MLHNNVLGCRTCNFQLPYWDNGIERPSSDQIEEYANLLTDLSFKEATSFVKRYFSTKRAQKKWDQKYKEQRKQKGAKTRVHRQPKEAVSILTKWYEEHESHPYPSKEERAEFARTTRLTEDQIKNWFGY